LVKIPSAVDCWSDVSDNSVVRKWTRCSAIVAGFGGVWVGGAWANSKEVMQATAKKIVSGAFFIDLPRIELFLATQVYGRRTQSPWVAFGPCVD